MPSKKKKYNSRFPPARIKKIMQTDDEIGKVAAAVPVLISKCLEMFLSSILSHTGEVTKAKKAKTMSTSHLKECISNVSMFDFLKDVVASVPDMQVEDEPSTSAVSVNEEQKKPLKKRNIPAPKQPRKRIKLEQQKDSGDNEVGSVEEAQESSNGVHPSYAVPTYPTHDSFKQPFQTDSLPKAIEEKPSCRTELMSPDSRTRSDDDMLEIATDQIVDLNDAEGPYYQTQPQDLSTTKAETAYMLSEDFAEQDPMDLSKDSKKLYSKTDVIDSKVSKNIAAHQLPSQVKMDQAPQRSRKRESDLFVKGSHFSVAGPPHTAIPSPSNLSHLYSPASLPAPSTVGMSGAARDSASGIPQGGMLSFLYSAYPGDVPTMPQGYVPETQGPPGVQSRSVKDTSVHRHVPQPNANPTLLYPYNPISSFHQNSTSSPLPHPYVPNIEPIRTIPDSMSIKRPEAVSDDDEDYDV